MSSIFKLYMQALKFHPWKTQLLTTGFLMASSDVIAQTAIEKRSIANIELPRVLRFAVLGTCFVGPTIRVWYLTLERVIGTVGKTAGLKKMLCDQILFAPYFIGCFLTVLGAIQFQPWHTIMAKLQEDYFTILRTNYMIWPGAQLITFYLIPLHLRVVFVSFIALLWNTYLASQANKSYKN